MSFVTKYCLSPSPLLANCQNLFYDTKNQDELPPLGVNQVSLNHARTSNPPTFMKTSEVNNETDPPGNCRTSR
ncbi:hypothetical protein C6560_01915 [Enterobacter sp. FS01]|nr:hypothetical protein C6560_01915 [Enterobacter sp. FS01]